MPWLTCKPLASRFTRAGFTLVELLVVMAIISVLIALLLPAVQAAREASRRSACTNQLKQIGLGLLGYESQQRRLPPGAVVHENASERGYAWRVSVLPFLEEAPLYALIDPQANGDYIQDVGATPEIWLCPSVDTPGGDLLPAHYTGIAGSAQGEPASLDLPNQSFYGDAYIDGVLYADSRTRLAQITDGTSHTVVVGEAIYLPTTAAKNWMFGVIWVAGRGGRVDEMQIGPVKNLRYPINADNDQFGYYRWDTAAPTGAARTMLENDLPFGSQHPGGANFLMVDGSVHFLSDELDFTILQDLATRANDEVNRWVP